MASIEIQKPNDNPLLKEVFDMVVAQRRGYSNFSFKDFDKLIEDNITDVCDSFNTRWLVSVCDTYADSDDKEIAAKAMIIITLVNMVKLWGTDLNIRSQEVDSVKLKKYKNSNSELWDGVITFRLSFEGDMFKNMIARQSKILGNHPVLTPIYKRILSMLSSTKNPLSDLMDKR